MAHYDLDEEVLGAFASFLRTYYIWQSRPNPSNEQNLKNIAKEFQRICNQKYQEEKKASEWFRIIGKEKKSNEYKPRSR